MERKEVIERCSNILKASVDLNFSEQDKQALQTAISHLETLQKVKDMGGVKKRNYVLDGAEPQDDREYEPAWVEGWNDCFDAVHAELAEKLEGLEEFLEASFPVAGLRRIHLKMIISTIQKLILGKKEE